MEFKDKIRILREQSGLTLEEVAKKVGVSAPTIQRYETGDIKNVRRDKIAKLATALYTTPSYLMDWEEPDFDYGKYGLKPVVKRKVPHLGKIACGEPIFIVQENDEYNVVDTDITIDFSLTAVGDSMTGANINDGDIVYIRTQSTVNNGEIAAIIIGDTVTLKRVYLESDKLILQSENKVYSPKVFEGAQLEDIRILGKAVLCQFKIK